MDLLFSNIPKKTREGDLYEFVAKGIKGWRLMASDSDITRCEILEITDQQTGQTEYHGLVTIRNPKLGEKAIKKLNGKVFMGSSIAKVREYTHRSPGDRRYSRENLGLERPEERRRENLIIEARSKRRKGEKIDVEAMADWVRQHGS